MVPTRIALKRSSNYHEAAFPKCRGVAEFHSIHELLCVALLEGDPKVVSIETQPEKIRGANGKAYIPDVRFQTVEKTTYLEVKSEGGWAREGKRIEPLLRAFATQRGADHGHCLHEQLDQQARRAFAFIRITRWILQYADTDLSHLSPEALAQYLARLDAVQTVLAGKSIASAAVLLRCSQGEVYRLLKKCLESDIDGSPSLKAGLIPEARLDGYDYESQ